MNKVLISKGFVSFLVFYSYYHFSFSAQLLLLLLAAVF
jgi:hypothetical protein